jgi:hypothetical protein
MYQFYNFWSQLANQSAILSSSPPHFLVGTIFTEIEGQSNQQLTNQPTNQPTMQRCVVQILQSSNVTFATLNDDSSHPKRLQKRPIFHHTAAEAPGNFIQARQPAGWQYSVLWRAQPSPAQCAPRVPKTRQQPLCLLAYPVRMVQQ